MRFFKDGSKQISSLILVFVSIIMLTVPATVFASDANKKTDISDRVLGVGDTIKVGMMYEEGIGTDSEDYYDSWEYKYLQKLASIGGWSYEYVFDTYPNLYKMLLDGELDMMGNVLYSRETLENMAYVELPEGTETFYIYIKDDGKNMAGDLSILKGKKIGLINDPAQIRMANSFIENRNAECEFVPIDGFSELRRQLDEGEVFGAVYADLPEGGENRYIPIATIGVAPFYFVVEKNNKKLLDSLNTSMSMLISQEPYYYEMLYTEEKKDAKK